MPRGNVTGKTNCRVCIDCEPMRGGTSTCFRCYGEVGHIAPLKKDFAINKTMPPKTAPKWCPNRED